MKAEYMKIGIGGPQTLLVQPTWAAAVRCWSMSMHRGRGAAPAPCEILAIAQVTSRDKSVTGVQGGVKRLPVDTGRRFGKHGRQQAEAGRPQLGLGRHDEGFVKETVDRGGQ